MSNKLRITGMATGMDTDTTIKQLMKPYNMKLDKMKQDKQIVQWKQDLYREIIGDINTLKNTYFDTLINPSTSILNKNNYSILDASTDIQNAVSLTAGLGAVAGSYSVKVDKLAKGALLGDVSLFNNALVGVDKGSGVNISDWEGKNIKFKIDNTTEAEITIGNLGGVNTLDNLVNKINDAITKNADLKGKLLVSKDGTGLKFNTLTNNSIKIINASSNEATMISNGSIAKNKLLAVTSSTKLSDLGVTSTNGAINIKGTGLDAQGVDISIDSSKTIGSLINDINAKCGGVVTAKFSDLTGKFTIQTVATGSGQNISITQTNASILSELNITDVSSTGVDAQVSIKVPGASTATTVVKSTNNFTMDGINYSLLNTNTTESTINLTQNTQKAVDKIKTFVGKYNELLDKIQAKLEQKKSGYVPLTDEQKSAMKPEEIAKWEDKAKEGILRNDDLLSRLTQDLRNTLYEKVKGAGIALSDSIGFGTIKDTTKRGQISIDENKLKAALENNGEQIMNLFCKTSESRPIYSRDMNSDTKKTRISEEGIFQRVKDVLEDYTSTMYRDANGKKGYLIEKAGIKGDLSDIKNLYYEDLKDKDTRIIAMQRKISDKENQYYNQFAKLEVAMNKLNSQQSWLASQLGGK